MGEVHVGLSGSAVSFAGITGDTGGDDVVPPGDPSMIARDNVIEIELMFWEGFAAILAGMLVAEKDVLSRKFYLLAGNTIVERENDDLGNLKRKAHGVNHFMGDRIFGILHPRTDIVCLVAGFSFGLHHLCMAEAEKFEGSLNGASMNGLPKTVEDQDGSLQDHFHRSEIYPSRLEPAE